MCSPEGGVDMHVMTSGIGVYDPFIHFSDMGAFCALRTILMISLQICRKYLP